MKKLTLDLDTLSVQTFVATPDALRGRGTVAAHSYCTDIGITCVGHSVCGGSGTDEDETRTTLQTRIDNYCVIAAE
jgi:hypothetical protein